ncbi:RHS repeat-associated core domain-containing protein [Hahella ganghwensis]|uniref:RHS repeat-associated core domain-containing protein n=1 Tax=Hahella ganghwensis TaxID=286420 RepID=UPI001FE1B469|nr:RHS repeat-associated core domain-containing protein [Hahella ganghwensis]
MASTGSTENDYRYTGEQYDAGLDQYYLRARYYDQGVGRFTQMDTWMGVNSDPITLHKYLYANADPVAYTDPTGNFGLFEASVTNTIATELSLMKVDAGLSALDTVFGSLGINDSTVETVRTASQVAGIIALGAGGVKLLVMLSKKARDCIKKNCDLGVWSRISPTGSNHPGSVIPVTFRYSSNSGHAVWVNSNATKHLAEYAQSLARSLTPEKVRLGSQLQLESLGSAIDTATKNGVPLNTRLNIDGWQLEFRRSDGDELPVLIHALYEG